MEIIAASSNGINVNEITFEADLVRDFQFTSINIIQLVVELESQFNIEIDDDNLLIEKLSPYQSLIEIIKDKIGEEQI